MPLSICLAITDEKMRIRKYYLILLLALLLLTLSACTTQPQKQKTNPQKNLIYSCTPTQLFRCEPKETSCLNIPIHRTHGAIQIIIDLPAAYVKSVSGNKVLTESNIDSVQIEGQLIYLHGKGIGYDKAFRSWNAIIDRQNGELYSSSVTTGAGHITYGECHEIVQ